MNDKMKITTIRLEANQLDWIRANHPQNLSRIVREHIHDLMHRATPVNFHNAWRESAQKCYPYMKGGYCNICWPAGIPDREIWQNYMRENGANNPYSLTFEEWSLNNHNNRQKTLDDWNLTNTNTISKQESSQTISNQANIQYSFLSRIIRAIFRRH